MELIKEFEMSYEELLSELTRFRKLVKQEYGYTVPEICNYLGISISSINKWEAGLSVANTTTIMYCVLKLKELLKKSFAYTPTRELYIVKYFYVGGRTEHKCYYDENDMFKDFSEIETLRVYEGASFYKVFLKDIYTGETIYCMNKFNLITPVVKETVFFKVSVGDDASITKDEIIRKSRDVRGIDIKLNMNVDRVIFGEDEDNAKTKKE